MAHGFGSPRSSQCLYLCSMDYLSCFKCAVSKVYIMFLQLFRPRDHLGLIFLWNINIQTGLCAVFDCLVQCVHQTCLCLFKHTFINTVKYAALAILFLLVGISVMNIKYINVTWGHTKIKMQVNKLYMMPYLRKKRWHSASKRQTFHLAIRAAYINVLNIIPDQLPVTSHIVKSTLSLLFSCLSSNSLFDLYHHVSIMINT